MQPITSQTLETERLILRAWRADDLEDFYAYASEPGVGERAGWKHHETREESRRILESFIRAQEVFAVVLRSEQRAIGSLGVHPSWAAELPAFAAVPPLTVTFSQRSESSVIVNWSRSLS